MNVETDSNDHITKYLDYYLSIPESPEFAIMLRGNWGSGKTWFLKKYLEERKEKDYLYVSLYGLSTYKEIEDEFFQQLHPILSSKGMSIAGKILKGALKATIKLDLDGDKKDEGSITTGIPEINIPDYLKDTKGRILVFDDLERCAIPIPSILGYINHFVEISGLKVIVVANEDEIRRVEGYDEDNRIAVKYSTIKEKVFGRSFEIKTNFESAYKHFVSQLANNNLKVTLNNFESLVLQIYDKSSYNNLRHLKQTILDFDRFYNLLPDKAIEHNEMFEHILNLFFPISIELKNGVINEQEIINLFHSNYLLNDPKEEKTPSQKTREKYTIFGMYFHPITADLWMEFFRNGTMDSEELNKSIESSRYFLDEKTPDWIKLWYYPDLTSPEFKVLVSIVYDQFKGGTAFDKYEVLQITGLLLDFSEKGLIKPTKATIAKIARKRINNLNKNNGFELKQFEEFPDEGSHGGLVYQGRHIQEFRDILDLMTALIKDTKAKNTPIFAQELLRTLQKSVADFSYSIELTLNDTHPFNKLPVLKYINYSKFVTEIKQLKRNDIVLLVKSFNKRYSFYDPYIKEEIPFLEFIYNYFTKQRKKALLDLNSFLVQQIMAPEIKKIIEKINRFSDNDEL